MVFFFSGLGFLAPVIGLAALIIGIVGAGAITGDSDSNAEAAMGFAIFGVLAAIACWIIGRVLNDPAKDRLAIDKATGKEIRISRRHRFLFIPLQWWSLVYAALAAWLAIGSMMGN